MIKKLFSKIKLWLELRQQAKALDKYFQVSQELFPNDHIRQDNANYLYQEGLSKVKKIINSKASLLGYEKVLSGEELTELAKYDDPEKEEWTKQLKRIYVYSKERPKKEMISNRIQQYYDLQKNIEERKLLRGIRKAKNEGNEKLARELEEQWNNGRTSGIRSN